MTEFMRDFPEMRDRDAALLADLEMRIPKILDHMSS